MNQREVNMFACSSCFFLKQGLPELVGDFKTSVNQFLESDVVVMGLPCASNTGVSTNRDTPKWMVYNGKPY